MPGQIIGFREIPLPDRYATSSGEMYTLFSMSSSFSNSSMKVSSSTGLCGALPYRVTSWRSLVNFFRYRGKGGGGGSHFDFFPARYCFLLYLYLAVCYTCQRMSLWFFALLFIVFVIYSIFGNPVPVISQNRPITGIDFRLATSCVVLKTLIHQSRRTYLS